MTDIHREICCSQGDQINLRTSNNWGELYNNSKLKQYFGFGMGGENKEKYYRQREEQAQRSCCSQNEKFEEL